MAGFNSKSNAFILKDRPPKGLIKSPGLVLWGQRKDSSMEKSRSTCVVCARNSDMVPLIQFHFQGQDLMICTQHLPVLIHEPGQLVGKLPGSENLAPAEHQD